MLKIKNVRLRRVKEKLCSPKASCVYSSLSVSLLGKPCRTCIMEGASNLLPESCAWVRTGEIILSPLVIPGKDRLALTLKPTV